MKWWRFTVSSNKNTCYYVVSLPFAVSKFHIIRSILLSASRTEQSPKHCLKCMTSACWVFLSSDHLLQAINQFNLRELFWFYLGLELHISFPRKPWGWNARRFMCEVRMFLSRPQSHQLEVTVVVLCFLYSQLSFKILGWFHQENK